MSSTGSDEIYPSSTEPKDSFMDWLTDNNTLTTILVVILLVVVLGCCIKTVYTHYRQIANGDGPARRNPNNINIAAGDDGGANRTIENFDNQPIHEAPPTSPVPETMKILDFEKMVPPPSPPPTYQTPRSDRSGGIRARRDVKSVGSSARGSSFIARLRKSFRRRGSQSDNAHALESGQLRASTRASTTQDRNNNKAEDDVFG